MNTTLLLQAAAPQGGNFTFIIMMVAIFAIMWLFMIRPQQKKQKEIRKFQNSLTEGTSVVLGGGIYGTVKRVDLTTGKIEVEIARGVVINVDKSYVFADINATQMNTQAK
ncbi:MAG: preprotein translocase subunit YajC [Prevotella sp.]|nr:preprotein translocase subunit YajC [Prevotella sp.]MBQ9178700.1 preprotein translocase subunit YajC [Prevotella sp.]MBQ9670081.1 preprotein translocase subunit YajC [Prevotella sp.]MDY6229744.1 preprotein translocase subunit YajC [Prevotella sp.]MDY6408357.1 preprotein translocase subunit YajC [Prevotella sp.]